MKILVLILTILGVVVGLAVVAGVTILLLLRLKTRKD